MHKRCVCWNSLFYLQSSEERRLDIASVALTDIELAKIVLEAVERKQTSNRKKQQKEFKLVIAEYNVEILRR